jgi:hypothetical protein
MLLRHVIGGLALTAAVLTTGCCHNKCRSSCAAPVPCCAAPAPAPCCNGAPGGPAPVQAYAAPVYP